MKPDDHRQRVVIAVTETCPVRELWKAALRHISGPQAEVVTLYLTDERWYRAASLSFTSEISRVGGTVADFTRRRAEQVAQNAVDRVRRRIEELAAEAGMTLAFEVLTDSESHRVTELAGSERIVLVAPSILVNQPVYTRFEALDWQIVLVDTTEQSNESQ